MYNVNTPPQSELPSSRALVRSTVIAAVVAALLLTTVVLPAEYGVDPTGVGSVLGLTEMGQIKRQLAQEAAEAEAAESAAAAAAPAPAPAVGATPAANSPSARTDSVSLTLEPGQGREIKLAMREGARVDFSWSVAGGVVNYDTHADRPGLSYHGYEKGQAKASQEGVLVAAFDGMHGWFWRNRGRETVTVTLRTTGDYQDLKEIN